MQYIIKKYVIIVISSLNRFIFNIKLCHRIEQSCVCACEREREREREREYHFMQVSVACPQCRHKQTNEIDPLVFQVVMKLWF